MQLRVEKVSLMGTVIVPIFFMYYSIIKRRYMRNERYDNDSKFNKNLWKTQRCGGCNHSRFGKAKFWVLGPNGGRKINDYSVNAWLIKYDQGEIRINGLTA